MGVSYTKGSGLEREQLEMALYKANSKLSLRVFVIRTDHNLKISSRN